MNLVAGATGMLGTEICRLLASGGSPTRALVRNTSDPAKVENLDALGVEVVVGDLRDRASLDSACHGVRSVISTASSLVTGRDGDSIQTVDCDGQINLIDAAKSAGVEHFVLISFPEMNIDFPLQRAKRQVEQHLKVSGLKYTILQPTFFMEVWLSPGLGFNFPGAEAQIYGSGDKKISWISFKDVAKFAVESLKNPAAENAVIKLGGPEALSPLEVIGIFQDVFGKTFSVTNVPVEALEAQKAAAADPIQETFAALMLSYAIGDTIEMDETLKRFPVDLNSVKDYAYAVS